MDLQETPGARVTDESAQILLDVPALSQGVDGGFQAIPLGLVVKKDVVVTVSSRKNTVLDALTAGKGPVPPRRFLQCLLLLAEFRRRQLVPQLGCGCRGFGHFLFPENRT